ncbi:hypothetical protein FRB95_001264 [Tulasnella sp. JGI-2019a]|nr:hypothetical protein FRB95_001264 [Tulasnella sp. JGI-2019a]
MRGAQARPRSTFFPTSYGDEDVNSKLCKDIGTAMARERMLAQGVLDEVDEVIGNYDESPSWVQLDEETESALFSLVSTTNYNPETEALEIRPQATDVWLNCQEDMMAPVTHPDTAPISDEELERILEKMRQSSEHVEGAPRAISEEAAIASQKDIVDGTNTTDGNGVPSDGLNIVLAGSQGDSVEGAAITSQKDVVSGITGVQSDNPNGVSAGSQGDSVDGAAITPQKDIADGTTTVDDKGVPSDRPNGVSEKDTVGGTTTANDKGVPNDSSNGVPAGSQEVSVEGGSVAAEGPEVLDKDELQWASQYEFLQAHGYLLRPRYRPEWVASWLPGPYDILAEDGILISHPETSISEFLWSEDLQKDPRNHSCPLLDVLRDDSEPDREILVLAVLRRLDEPRPASVRECVDLIEQMLEGLVFMHEHKVAHRDCAFGNVMMDARAMFPKGWHPQSIGVLPNGARIKNVNPSRTAAGSVQYHFIDFGISSHNEDFVRGFDGQERAPELSDDISYDPYKLDVFILGMFYQHFLVENHIGVDFILPLIKYMTPESPSERPSAAEAFDMFKTIQAKMTNNQLSQRLRPVLKPEDPQESTTTRIVKDAYYRICDRWWMLRPKKKLEPLT